MAATFVAPHNLKAPPSNAQGLLLRRLCDVDIRTIPWEKFGRGAASEKIAFATANRDQAEEVRNILLELGAEDKRASSQGSEVAQFNEAHQVGLAAADKEPEGKINAEGKEVEFSVFLCFEPGTSKLARYVKAYHGGVKEGQFKPGIRMHVAQFGEDFWKAQAYAAEFAKHLRNKYGYEVNAFERKG